MVKRALHDASDVDDGQAGRTMADIVYRRLRTDIVWGVLEPDAPLRSDDLRNDYQTGISPLREALTRLTAERLVTAVGQRGFRVAPLSADDVLDTMETRVLIESEALRRSMERGSVSWETAVVAAAHGLRRTAVPTQPGPEAESWAGVHEGFHAMLIGACGSPWLIRLADILFAQAERHRICAVKFAQPSAYRDRPAEHDAIFEAVIARDIKLALANLERHYRTSAQQVANVIASIPRAAPASGKKVRRPAREVGLAAAE